jgi:4-hydroxy-4-methyl-2-oxoglutarate aldolase
MYGHIYYDVERPAPDLVAALGELPTSTISDAMGRHGAVSATIRPIYEGVRMAGAALTVLCFPGDNIMTHKAVQLVQLGDVLVIDDGDHETGCFGLRSAMTVRANGGVGAVMSGSVRDVAQLRAEKFPIFCRGVSPRAPQKNTPGSINVPIHIGGIVVAPGDILVGDDDGLVVVPLAMAEEVLEKGRRRDRHEGESTSASELPQDPYGATRTLDDMLKGKVVEHRERMSWRGRALAQGDALASKR